jgi:hypothetical protein
MASANSSIAGGGIGGGGSSSHAGSNSSLKPIQGGGSLSGNENLKSRQPLPPGRIVRTQSDNVSYGTHQKDYYVIQSVDISGWRIHKDEHGKTYAAYVVVVTMKSG